MARALLVLAALVVGLITSANAIPTRRDTKPVLEVHTIHDQLSLATKPTFGGDLDKTGADMTKEKTDADLKPSGCFCGGGSMCCYLGSDLDCSYGICGLGA